MGKLTKCWGLTFDLLWRHGGLCVGLRIKWSGFEPWPESVIVLCPWARHFTLIVPRALHPAGVNGYQQVVRAT